MNIDLDLKSQVKAEVAKEIEGLGVRAAVKEKLVEVGQLNKDQIRDLINQTIDSYIRSVNIDEMINKRLDKKFDNYIEKRIDECLKKYIEGGIFSPSPSKHLRDIILDNLKKQFDENYDLVVVNRKEQK